MLLEVIYVTGTLHNKWCKLVFSNFFNCVRIMVVILHIQFAVYLAHDAMWVQYYAASFLSCIVWKCSTTGVSVSSRWSH